MAVTIESQSIASSNFNFPNQTNFYKGKVRDVYTINNKFLAMVATDRISAFDHVLPRPIPAKGQVLNQIAAYFLEATKDVVPNWVIHTPDPNVTIGHHCNPYPVEMVIRGYLTGHAWRTYKSGKRMLCGVVLPEGLKEHDKFPTPIITPTTKEDEGHDMDITREEIISQGIVSKEEYEQLEQYTYKLFERGTQMAKERGLILVDTKYEFGKSKDGRILLIDEIHTPDSSRYFYLEGYQQRQENGDNQKQLSKEFVREWLMENGFQGLEGQQMPHMDDAFINLVTRRYIQLYEQITGLQFQNHTSDNIEKRVQDNILKYLNELS